MSSADQPQIFSALIDFPITIANHSPADVERPEFIVIDGICGDHARFVISEGAEYAMTGSEITRFLPSTGRGELSREEAFCGEPAGAWEWGARSQRRT